MALAGRGRSATDAGFDAVRFQHNALPELDYDGYKYRLVSTPVQFDEEPSIPGKSPDFNEHGDQILTDEDLPLRYGGLSTCFRREAGAAGKDTRGIFRVHQFDKVEMFSFVRPEDSAAEHQRILGVEEAILQAIEVPYRVIDTAAGDLGASAARKFDCEAWMPAQGAYREVTSCSNCTDYQARRLRTRVRRESGT